MQLGVNIHKMILTNLTFPAPQSVTFFGMLPEEITESHGTNFETLDIISRSNPLASYAGSTARSVDINVNINEDYLAEFMGGRADIREYVAKIKAMTYPQYQGTMVVPPKVLLRVGNFLRLKGYCNSCSITWKLPIREDHYVNAGISFTITETRSLGLTAGEVFEMGDLVEMG